MYRPHNPTVVLLGIFLTFGNPDIVESELKEKVSARRLYITWFWLSAERSKLSSLLFGDVYMCDETVF